MPPGSNQSSRSDAPEDALNAPVSLQRSDSYTAFAMCSLHLISAGSLVWILMLVPESRPRMIGPSCFLFRAEYNLRFAHSWLSVGVGIVMPPWKPEAA